MDMPVAAFCGRQFSAAEVQMICAVVQRCGGLSRMELAHTVCELLQWQRGSGGLKARECREFLELLEARAVLRLPPKRETKPVGARTRVPISASGEPAAALVGKVGAFEPIVLELVQDAEQRRLFRELVGRYHYLGHAVPFGAHLRYLFYGASPRVVLGCLQFSSPAWRMAVRERWIGWDEAARRRNLQRVVSNSRFLILPWVRIANLASVVLSRSVHRLGSDWQARYAVAPLLVETLVDASRATVATATGRPTGSNWGTRRGAGAWIGSTCARAPRLSACGSAPWCAMPRSC